MNKSTVLLTCSLVGHEWRHQQNEFKYSLNQQIAVQATEYQF
ncbi:MAG: hypothetical protein RI993_235 [Pseudomonadota bacterium]|jgi:hypothetical protein